MFTMFDWLLMLDMLKAQRREGGALSVIEHFGPKLPDNLNDDFDREYSIFILLLMFINNIEN